MTEAELLALVEKAAAGEDWADEPRRILVRRLANRRPPLDVETLARTLLVVMRRLSVAEVELAEVRANLSNFRKRL